MGNGEIPNTKAKGLRSERAHAQEGRQCLHTARPLSQPPSAQQDSTSWEHDTHVTRSGIRTKGRAAHGNDTLAFDQLPSRHSFLSLPYPLAGGATIKLRSNYTYSIKTIVIHTIFPLITSYCKRVTATIIGVRCGQKSCRYNFFKMQNPSHLQEEEITSTGLLVSTGRTH